MVSCNRLPAPLAAHMLRKLHQGLPLQRRLSRCHRIISCNQHLLSATELQGRAPSATCTSCGMSPPHTLITLTDRVSKAQDGLEATKGSADVAGWRLAAGRDGLWVGVRH